MRTDAPWPEIGRAVRRRLAPRPPKTQRLVEEEVAPGRLLFGPGRRQWLALLGTVFGLAGAGATTGIGAYRGAGDAAAAANQMTAGEAYGDLCLLILNCGVAPDTWLEIPADHAVLPAGRRRDPAW